MVNGPPFYTRPVISQFSETRCIGKILLLNENGINIKLSHNIIMYFLKLRKHQNIIVTKYNPALAPFILSLLVDIV